MPVGSLNRPSLQALSSIDSSGCRRRTAANWCWDDRCHPGWVTASTFAKSRVDVDVVIRGRFSLALLFSSALDRSSCADFAIPFAAIRIGRVIEAVSTLLLKAIVALEGSSLPKELQ